MKNFIFTLAILLGYNGFANAEEALFLANDQDAIQARADIIQQAKKEIMVEYYSVTEDATSIGAIALLCQASQRGVKVRIIMDSIPSSVKESTVAAVYKDCHDSSGKLNIEFRLFNPVNLLKPSTIFYRNHGKMLNVDGEVMITGGRNVDDKYFGFDAERNFIDLDIMIRGQSAVDAAEYFNKLWNKDNNVKTFPLKKFSPETLRNGCANAERYEECLISQNRDKKEVETASARLKGLIQTMESGTGYVKLNTEKDWFTNAAKINNAKFIFNSADNNVGKKNKSVSDELFRLVSAAEKEVLILSPYLIPTARAEKMFKDLTDRGVKVTIITNSLKSTDNVLAQAGYKDAKSRIIAMGIELYEFDLVDTSHAKTAVIDGRVAMIGTYNLDPRSDDLNREIGIIIDDQENTNIGRDLTDIINTFKDRSLLVGKDGKEQNVHLQNKDVGKMKIGITKILEMLLPVYREQL